jgi:hypothetical protein
VPRYLSFSADWPDWDALLRVHELCNGDPRFPAFDPHEFMNMGRHSHGTLPTIHLYKHVDTRRYLNVDIHGHAYVYREPTRLDDDIEERLGVHYDRLPDLLTAVRRVLEDFEHTNLYRSYPPDGWVAPYDVA